ncbi:LacI family DNA-binding transcriptional regulator [Tropicibacter naphthalenivorans]|uniref:HTH-type transcriptional repressor CytR n=1 Tax=Tropicibacter naphthalenivorans TaxID=441103 RepID=A0A0P1G7G6_9RHOB|nr:LacI family DNA-binding transcriptional regulator [Tropicibacter naphthalenivorans]CUH77536.1 HTH-type transcriptional repressor CytR [Tropicibacter naphthalenivorans]SMC56459.1 transcriptional regulator, LacI family [Tropicibacter naphthalenivorans]
MLKKPAKIQDVAKAAGVSTATVSRALSNPDKVAQPTRDAVMNAIRQTGYRVNHAARTLRTRRAGAVLVLTPNLGNPFFSKILSGISATLADNGTSVLIADSHDHGDVTRTALDYFNDARIDGIISLDGSMTPDQMAQFAQHDYASRIIFACEWAPDVPLPSVRSDNRAGVRLAVQHLYDLGHRHIAHVTGPEGNVLTAERREGMLAERSRLNLPVRDEWIIRGDFSLASGQAAAARILAMDHRPTAVFCASDMVAIGLIATLTQGGLRVPQDISVVGFDDIEMAEYTLPPLTTIRQNRPALGTRAAERLLAQIEDPSARKAHCPDVIDVELVVRKSTSPAPV